MSTDDTQIAVALANWVIVFRQEFEIVNTLNDTWENSLDHLRVVVITSAHNTGRPWVEDVYCKLLTEGTSENQRNLSYCAQGLNGCVKVISHVYHVEGNSCLLAEFQNLRPVSKSIKVICFDYGLLVDKMLLSDLLSCNQDLWLTNICVIEEYLSVEV